MTTRKKSTIVRASMATVRTSFWALEKLAPGLAARWALRIWCTPPHARGARDPRVAPGERFMVPITARPGGVPSQRHGVERGPLLGHGMVVAEAWGDGPTTYLLHGWGCRRGQLAAFVAPLVAAGQRVVALDAPGHGESGSGRLGGRRTTVPEIAEALAAVIAVAGPANAIIAHSGGGLATALAVHGGLPAGRLVLIAPMASPMPYLRPFADQLGLGRRSFARFLRRIERLLGRSLADFDAVAMAAAAEPGRLPPLLVIHYHADREVRHADGRALAEAWSWPGATLHSTNGLGHRRLLTDPSVIDAATAFITAAATMAGSSPRS